MLCPCGSTLSFDACCQLFITQIQKPTTAEQLMRSRFSAYALGNAQYIYDTYAKSSQAAQSVVDIDDWSKSCVWIALIIHPLANSVNNTTEDFVEFSAFYITNNTLCELREKSRFIFEATSIPEKNIIANAEVKGKSTLNSQVKQWRYIDGDIIAHSEITSIKRNELCPCNHYPTAWQINKAKKYKHCCGK